MNLFENLQIIKEDNNDIVPDINQRSFIKDMIEFLSDIQEKETIPQQCNKLIFDIYDKILELKDLIVEASDDSNTKTEEYYE